MKQNIKVILASILIMGVGLIAYSSFKADTSEQGIAFKHTAFDDLLLEAKKQDKLIFVDAYATWCGPCKKLTRKTFANKKVATYFNEHFINLKLDVDKPEGRKFATKYGVSSLPTLIFIDAEGEVVKKSVGYVSASQLLSIVSEIK